MQGFRQDGHQGAARLGGQEAGDLLCLFPLHQPGVHQLFQDGGAGGRSSNAAPFRIIGHILRPGALHAGEDGVLGEVLGRGRLALLHLDGLHRQRLALGQIVRQGGIAGPRGAGPPAHNQHRFALDGEAVPAALHCHGGLGIPMGRTDRPDQPQGHQPQHFMLPHGQGGEVGGGGVFGGDDGVVVADLSAVAHLGGQHRPRHLHTADHSGGRRQDGDAPLHIVRQIPAVRPGVSTQLFFIEGLQIVQRLLGGVAQDTVGVPLEGGQVVEGRGTLGFLFPLHRLDGGGATLTGGGDGGGVLFSADPLPGEGHAAAGQLHRVERLRLKGGDLRLPLGDHRQRGGHDPPDVQRPAIQQGEQPGGVDAHQPIRLLATQRRLVQAVIVVAGAEVVEPLPDGAVLHTADPQPFYRLGATRQIVGGAEDQLPLPASVTGVHYLGHVLPPKQGA